MQCFQKLNQPAVKPITLLVYYFNENIKKHINKYSNTG